MNPISGHLRCACWLVSGHHLIKGTSHKTENYVQISPLPPGLMLPPDPGPLRITQSSQHYCLSLSLSATLLNHVPSIAHLHGLDNGVMARTARAEANAAINEASTGPSCVLLQVFNYHT